LELHKHEEKIRKALNEKNKKIADTLLKERLNRSKTLLIRALRFNDVNTQRSHETTRREEKEKEFFFKTRVDLYDAISEFDLLNYTEFLDEAILEFE